MISEKIVRQTHRPYNEVISLFDSEISREFKLFPDRVMNGKLKDGEIRAVINPPMGFSDPFKSRVKGVITEIEGTTQINLHVKPAWIIIAFWLFWTFVLSIFLFQLDYKNIDFSIETIGHIFLFGVVPYLLGKLKVNWDKRRLLKWLKRRVLTVPNNGYSK